MRRASSRSGPYSRQGSLVDNISAHHLAGGPHLFGYVHLCWVAHPYHSQRQQPRSSRRSSGQVRTGSDPATTGGKSTPTSEFDLLQLPPGNDLAHSRSRVSNWLVYWFNDSANPSWFSAPLEVDQDLLTQANPSHLLGHPSSLLKSASYPIRHPMHAPTAIMGPRVTGSSPSREVGLRWGATNDRTPTVSGNT